MSAHQTKPEWVGQSFLHKLLARIVLEPHEIRGLDKSSIALKNHPTREKMLGRGVKNGTADHLVVQGDPLRILFIECKAGKGRMTDAQIATADSYERCGIMTVRDCKNMFQAVEGLRQAGFRLHASTDSLALEYQMHADASLQALKLRKEVAVSNMIKGRARQRRMTNKQRAWAAVYAKELLGGGEES